MSYFNFLSPDLAPDDTVADDENANAAAQGAIPTYSQRRGETSSKVIQTANKIIDKYEVQAPAEVKALAADTRRDIMANPDDAAKTLEKFHKAVQQYKPGETFGQSTPFKGFPELYDQDFSALENHVRGLRTMKRGAEEKALTGQLADTDLKTNLSELKNLQGQLDTVTKDIATKNVPEAVSELGELQNKQTLAGKQAQAAALSEHIKQLQNKTTTYNEPAPGEAQAPKVVNAPPDPTSTPGSQAPIGDYMGALGISREKTVDTVQKSLEIAGIHPDKLDDPVPTHAGLMRVLSALDPKGQFAQALANEMAQAKQQDAQEKESFAQQGKEIQGRMDETQQKINSREARMRQLYQQLNETPFMQTWPGIIMYVITGMLVGPGIATKIFGNLDNRRAIGNELDSLKFDIRRLDHHMDAQEREAANVRSAAIHRMQHREDRDQDFGRDLGKTVLQHNLILAREGQRHPEQAAAYKQLGSAYVRERQQMQDAQHRKDEAQRILSNDFSDEGLKKKAQTDLNAAERDVQFYRGRALWVDAKIKELGGVSIPEGGEGEGQ